MQEQIQLWDHPGLSSDIICRTTVLSIERWLTRTGVPEPAIPVYCNEEAVLSISQPCQSHQRAYVYHIAFVTNVKRLR